jgi:hypothetical protein
MTEINPQLYDQLDQRLGRQDECLERILASIETNQSQLKDLITSHGAEYAADLARTKTSLFWLKWVIGGLWAAIAGLFVNARH